jgi:hypothetical protein
LPPPSVLADYVHLQCKQLIENHGQLSLRVIGFLVSAAFFARRAAARRTSFSATIREMPAVMA